MLASTAFVACTNEDDVVNNEQAVAKGEKSYIAVNLNMTPSSRASFDEGLVKESAATEALFYFFDKQGNAFDVDLDEVGTQNCLVKSISLADEGTVNNSVSHVATPVLVINGSKDVLPHQILAVLNAPAKFKDESGNGVTKALSELVAECGAYNGDAESGFVMTNSVYKHKVLNEAVVATELAADNFFTSADEATESPLDIYVERVAAKVSVTADYNKNGKFATGQKMSDGTEIYAKIKGWKVTNIKNEAYLLKKIDTSWTDAVLGITNWNDASNFRSYWANTASQGSITHPWNWNQLSTAATGNDNYGYYYENTDANNNNKSQLLVAATFEDANGNALQIAEWYGARYYFNDLATAIANALKSTIYVKNGDAMTSIAPEDITFFQAEDDEDSQRYLSYATLATASENKTFVDENGEAINAKDELEALEPALIWKEGGYYYTTIKHLGAEGKTAEFGLVRNHLYQVTVDGITGLGTPVYDPNKKITPEPPVNLTTYLSAQINVLAWKVVNQSVTLK